MATRETKLDLGRRRGRGIVRHVVSELASTRRALGISQDQLAEVIGCSQSELSRLERLVRIDDIPLVRLAETASVLGLELGAGLHPVGDGMVDSGHRALIARFRAVLAPAWQVAAEVPLAIGGDQRSWDLLLRIPGQLIGVEAETRIRDEQALVRRIRLRERDGGANVILIVLSNNAHNRAAVGELRATLGAGYASSPRRVLPGLRAGLPIPGSGVILM